MEVPRFIVHGPIRTCLILVTNTRLKIFSIAKFFFFKPHMSTIILSKKNHSMPKYVEGQNLRIKDRFKILSSPL